MQADVHSGQTARPNGTGPALVEVEDLKIHFPLVGGETVKAVDGVSLSVTQGDTISVIGESGSGKSTLARAMLGLMRPTAGTLRQAGVDPHSLPAAERRRLRRDFQIVFQDPHAALNPRMTLLRSVCEPLLIAGETSKKACTEQALSLLSRVGIAPDVANRYPHELSGGQKQRGNIARALILDPKVLVADEATAALDVSIQADILNLYLDLQEERNLAFVCITHDLPVALHLSDRIAIMYLGRLVEMGPAAEIAHHSLHPYTQALLSAEPMALPKRLRQQQKKRVMLQGEIPSPVDPPSGCRFRTRCPLASARCAAEVPEWREAQPGHWVACHLIDATGASSSPSIASASC